MLVSEGQANHASCDHIYDSRLLRHMHTDQNEQFVVSKIKALITSAEEELLRDISRYDNHGDGNVTYEQACNMHSEGLKDLIYTHGCKVNWSEHYWFPMEAVELRAFVPNKGDSRSFAISILLLLLDDIEDGGRDHMQSRSDERYITKYRTLPKEYRKLIFEGLKILEETEASNS